MAAIDLSELIPSLRAKVSPLGTSLYEGVADTDWLLYLINGFYDAVLEGVLEGWTSDEDGSVTALSGSETMGRDLQQVAVIYAAMDIVRNQLLTLKSTFRAKAGPVEYETQQQATVLRGVLDQLMAQKQIILDRLARQQSAPTFYIDAIQARDYSIYSGLTHWIGN